MVITASSNNETTTIRNGGGPARNNLHGKEHNNGASEDHSSDDEKSTASYESSRKNGGGGNSNMKSVKNKTGEYEAEKIRVGRDYQVLCPEWIPEKDRNPEGLPEKALLVWSPTKDIPEKELEKYITVAKEKYGYNGEQALGMLFWHKHDLERAIMDLANFTPFPDEWTVEDKVLFEQAFQFHGKSFNRIRQMLPDKSIASLVKYYYSWKKTRARPNILDRPERNKNKHGSENGSEPGSNEVSDLEEKITIDEVTPRSSPKQTQAATTTTKKEEDADAKTTNSDAERPKKVSSPSSKPEIEITQVTTSNNNKRQAPTPPSNAAAAAPGLDEITIVPIARQNSTTTTTSEKDGPPPAKQIKLDNATPTVVVPVSTTAAAGGP
ncbi:REST corepressor-like [Culicoides brevitarsis]|uniref:REST corepressor-like n=1 Tax=Culicoides brevitarsis TaxID=469753 RepID=UPI00307C3683